MEKERVVTPTSPSSSSPSLLFARTSSLLTDCSDVDANNIRKLIIIRRRSKAAGRRKRSRHAGYCCSTTARDEEPGAGEMFDTASDEERAQVERKIAALQRIVPGGESLEVEKLFEETAEYILALEGKVIAMKLLTSLFQGFQQEETKLGG